MNITTRPQVTSHLACGHTLTGPAPTEPGTPVTCFCHDAKLGAIMTEVIAPPAPVPDRLTTCSRHNEPLPATMLQAAEDVHLMWGTAIGKFLATCLSMGGAELAPPCCPAAAHARFLHASAFRTYSPAGGAL